MSIKLSLQEYIHYKKNVGVDGMHCIGIPGQGKSVIATRVAKDCLKSGENFLIPGDRFCEWRHFLNFTKTVKKITLLVPEGQELYYHKIPSVEEIVEKYHVPFIKLEVDYSTLQIMDYFTEESRGEIVVVYDSHYRGKWLWKRAELWVNIVENLLDRITLLDEAIGILFHEAGILFQEGARDKHWNAIDCFSQLFVECRKGLVRIIFLSQLKTEIESTIRKKCLWQIRKKGMGAKDDPVPVKKHIPFAARNEYTLMCGGLYVRDNEIKKIKEIKEPWKMIPRGLPPEAADEANADIKKKKEDYQHRKAMNKAWLELEEIEEFSLQEKITELWILFPYASSSEIMGISGKGERAVAKARHLAIREGIAEGESEKGTTNS